MQEVSKEEESWNKDTHGLIAVLADADAVSSVLYDDCQTLRVLEERADYTQSTLLNLRLKISSAICLYA